MNVFPNVIFRVQEMREAFTPLLLVQHCTNWILVSKAYSLNGTFPVGVAQIVITHNIYLHSVKCIFNWTFQSRLQQPQTSTISAVHFVATTSFVMRWNKSFRGKFAIITSYYACYRVFPPEIYCNVLKILFLSTYLFPFPSIFTTIYFITRMLSCRKWFRART